MRWLTILLSLLWLPAAPVSAQLLHPNAAGVSSGHLHMLVRNPEAHKKIWVESLGAEVVKSGSLELLKLRGIFLVLEKAEPVGGGRKDPASITSRSAPRIFLQSKRS